MLRVALACFVMLTVTCGASVFAGPTPAPAPLVMAEIKYRVMDAAGRIEFCDSDFYPIARADEQQLANAKIAVITSDTDIYAAITKRVGADTLAVYREWKSLNALQLTLLSGAAPAISQSWRFAYRASGTARGATPAPKQGGTQVEGTVDVYGKVDVTKRTDAGPLNCPICLAKGTRIATPRGEIAVQDLRVGDMVWTQDRSGARVAAPLVAIGATPVPATHEVVRLILADGRTVRASPGHPTADGRRVGDLRAGDVLDGAAVLSAMRDGYTGGATFDVLPAGDSGAYWADGVLLGSTLR